jgi:predicted dehydrogenase
MDEARLVMVSDLSEQRLGELTELAPDVETTTDYWRLLERPDIDAVVVATPIRTHFRLAMDALLQGKHVLVEKPLAASSDECEEMIDTAQMVGRTLMVGHTFQYNPAVQKLRELVKRGDLGEIYYLDSARLNLGLFQRDIDVIWDLAPHDISILLHVLGQQPEAVSARGAAHVVKSVDDLGQLDLQFPGDVMAHIRVSWLDPFKVRRLVIVGSRKMAVFDDMAEHKLQVYDKRVALRESDGMIDPNFEYHDGDIETPPLDWVEPLRGQLSHYVDCIQTGRCPMSDGKMGLEVVRIIEAAEASRRMASRRVWLRPASLQRLEVLPPAEPARLGRLMEGSA